jgi:type I restriction enzyme S subunit
MPNLNTGILNAVPIMLPDFNILRAFDEIVRTLDEKISYNHTHINALSGTRDTLLPRLISGQLRLPDSTPE